MYNGSNFGYNIYKKNQVNMGTPYSVKTPAKPVTRKPELDDDDDDDDEFHEGIPSKTKAELAADILDEARRDADLIRKEAEFEAQRIVEDASEAMAIKAIEAEQKAKEEGYRNGENLARAHYEELVNEATQLRNQAQLEYNEMMASLEYDAMHMILNIARKVIGDEVKQNPDVILSLVQDAVKACSNRENIVLKVSSADYDYVVAHEDQLRTNIPGLHELTIRRELSMAQGTCQVDTGFGIADGSIEVKLQAIELAFHELIGEKPIQAVPPTTEWLSGV